MNRRYVRVLPLSISTSLVLTLALLAAPGVDAAKPVRTVLGPSAPFVIPAGQGCAFDVGGQPSADARRMIFEFDSNRTVFITNGNPIFSNLATGATFDHKARYHIVETYNSETNEITDETTGQITISFWPGDEGPWGVVSYPGLLLRFTGETRSIFDLDTESVSSFSYSGRVIDVCAALAK